MSDSEETKVPAKKKCKTMHGATTPISLDPVVDPSAPTTSTIDLTALKKKWTAAGEERFPVMKKRWAMDHPLQGGDWVLNKKGKGATLSFCFEFEERVYGLTVGRLANIGEPIYCFTDDTLLDHPMPDGVLPRDPEKAYYTFEVGKVVSKSFATDSLVFEFHRNEVAIGPVKTLAAESGLVRPLELPDPDSAPARPQDGDDLVGFGAQRRGSHGIVSYPSETEDGKDSWVGNIRIFSPEGDDKNVTDPGDCGTVFFDLNGTPLYFHHCARLNDPKASYGFPLAQVMSSHTQLGGQSEEHQQQERGILASPGSSQIAGLKQFRTNICPPEEERGLAQWNVRIIVTAPDTSTKTDQESS